jgi:putative ABC transport system permease protein
VVAQNLLDRLGLQIGDSLRIGESTLTIADVVLSEPDQPIDFFGLGPRVFLTADDLQATGLVQLGSRISYRALLRVSAESQLDAVAARLSAVADPAQVRVDTYRTNQFTVQRFFDHFLTFLSLIGIFTLLLAGIGIQSSLSAFIREREGTIAILRTIGATGRFIMRQFYGVAALLGLAGTLIGLALGALLQWVFPLVFRPFLPPQVEFILSLRAILEGILLGFFVVTIFTILPIYQLQAYKPHFIFRKEESVAAPGAAFFLAQALILLFLSGMTFRHLQNAQRTAYFAAGIVGLVLVITMLARAILLVLRRQKIARLEVRQALRGLFRPRNATTGIIVTLAASLSVLFTLFLIERNLDASFVGAYPEDAPNIVLLDIQPDQRDGIRQMLGGQAEFVPLVRARLQRINGVALASSTDRAQDQNRDPDNDGPPRLDSLQPVTYRNDLAPSERLLAGGKIFSLEGTEVAQVSIAESLLQEYPFQIGDRLQFDVQGVALEAQLTSIRAVSSDEAGFTPVFNFVFREQDLAGAPQTIVTTARIPDAEVAQFQNRLVAAYPNVTVIDIGAAIDVLAKLVADITIIIRFFTAFSIVAGVLIIISSVLATRFARIQESVYYKVLGAKRRFVLRVFALENIFIGLVSALLALFLSQLAGWILVTQVFELSYTAYWGSSFLLMLFTVGLVTAVGLLASISILKKKPMTFLREQTVE